VGVHALQGDAAIASTAASAAARSASHPWLGIGLTVLAFGSIVVAPSGIWTIALAAAAALALARDRRLGAFGAAIAVVIALPYGRGADVLTFEIHGVPIRPADVVIAGALVAMGWRARHGIHVPTRARSLAAGVTVLAMLGVVALVIGAFNDAIARDVLRDARWWFLYVAAIGGAITLGYERQPIVRGLLLGATLLAAGSIAASLLPAFDGGLKAQALTYDRGTLRMQFGNSVFLVPAIAWVAVYTFRSPTLRSIAWLTLLVVGITITLTRTSLLVTGAVILLIVLLRFVAPRSRPRLSRLVPVLAAAVVAVPVGLVLAVTGQLGSMSSGPASPEQPIDRITFQSDASSIATTLDATESGRLITYRNAIALIQEAPVLGAGFGSTVCVPFAYNINRASTLGMQPGVDDAYLTVGMKAGIVGIVVFGLVILSPLFATMRRSWRRWFLPGWLGVLALTLTQSFAVSGYAPFVLGALIALPFLGYTASNGRTAAAHV
jgi:hypothetical protein